MLRRTCWLEEAPICCEAATSAALFKRSRLRLFLTTVSLGEALCSVPEQWMIATRINGSSDVASGIREPGRLALPS